MSWLDWIGFGVTLAVMGVGLIFCILPPIPGPLVIFLAGAGYWYFVGDGLSGTGLGIIGGLGLLAISLDYLAGVLGAKRYGATAWGMVGAMLGGVVGFFLGVLGIILGPFVGAVLAEVLAGGDWQKALKAGVGTFVGFVLGGIGKIVCSIAMILVFLVDVLGGK